MRPTPPNAQCVVKAKKAKKDGIYRASLRGDFTYLRGRTQAIDSELLSGGVRPGHGEARLLETRRKVTLGWRIMARELAREGQVHLSQDVERFVSSMPPPRTEQQLLAEGIQRHVRAAHVPEPRLIR